MAETATSPDLQWYTHQAEDGQWYKTQAASPEEALTKIKKASGAKAPDATTPAVNPNPSTKARIDALMKGRKFEDLPLKEKMSIVGMGFGEMAQQEQNKAGGPEADKLPNDWRGRNERNIHAAKSLLDEIGGVAMGAVAGIVDPKTTAILSAGVVDPAIPAAYFGADAMLHLGPAYEELKKHPTPENWQNLLMTASNLALSTAGTTEAGEGVAGRAAKEVMGREGIRKTVQGFLGIGPKLTERAVEKSSEKFAKTVDRVRKVNESRASSTEASNRSAIEGHQDAIRDVEKQNQEARDEHTLKTEAVKTENARKVEEAQKKYQEQVADIEKVNAAKRDTGTRRAKLAEDLDKDSTSLGEGLKQLEKDVRTNEVNPRYDKVKAKVANDEGVPASELASDVKFAQDNLIKGTPEGIKQFSEILRQAGETGEPLMINGIEMSPDSEAFKKLQAEGALRPEELQGEEKLKFDKLQGLYTELGRKLARGIPDGDVYQAVKYVHGKIGLAMEQIAERNNAGDDLGEAQAYYRQFADTFYNNRSGPKGGSAVAIATDARDPGYYRRPFLSDMGKRSIDQLRRYSPQLADLAEKIRRDHEEFQANKKENLTEKPVPKAPEVKEAALPEPPQPKERPAAPELKTAKVVPEPNVDVPDPEKLKKKQLAGDVQNARKINRYDLQILASSALGPIMAVVLQDPRAMYGLALGPLGLAIKKGGAALLDRPAVVEWLTKPTAADMEALEKLPPQAQSAVKEKLSEFIAEENAKRGTPIPISSTVKRFLGKTGSAAIVTQGQSTRKDLLDRGKFLINHPPPE